MSKTVTLPCLSIGSWNNCGQLPKKCLSSLQAGDVGLVVGMVRTLRGRKRERERERERERAERLATNGTCLYTFIIPIYLKLDCPWWLHYQSHCSCKYLGKHAKSITTNTADKKGQHSNSNSSNPPKLKCHKSLVNPQPRSPSKNKENSYNIIG